MGKLAKAKVNNDADKVNVKSNQKNADKLAKKRKSAEAAGLLLPSKTANCCNGKQNKRKTTPAQCNDQTLAPNKPRNRSNIVDDAVKRKTHSHFTRYKSSNSNDNCSRTKKTEVSQNGLLTVQAVKDITKADLKTLHKAINNSDCTAKFDVCANRFEPDSICSIADLAEHDVMVGVDVEADDVIIAVNADEDEFLSSSARPC